MPDCRPLRKLGREFAGYAFAVVLCLLIVTWVLKLWRADLHIPLVYNGDGLLNSLWLKSLTEQGWYLTNPRVGAPGIFEMHDYPLSENTHFGMLWLLARGTTDVGVLYNLYLLIGYPLAAVTALGVLRSLGYPLRSALVGSLLFAFLPYHFMRSQMGHLFLAGYYVLPLVALVVFWVARGPLPLVAFDGPAGRARFQPWTGRSLAAVFILLLLSGSGIYYVFFSCFFLGFAGLAGSLAQRRWAPALVSLLLIGILVASVLVQLGPTLAYRLEHGPNPMAVERSPSDAEAFGLRLTQMFLPITEHRISWLRDFKTTYNHALGNGLNENGSAALGASASFGLLLLLGRFLFWPKVTGDRHTLDVLGQASLAAILLATVSGAGVFIALLGMPELRCYNRMSIFLGFFGIVGFVAVLESVLSRLPASRWGGMARLSIPTAVLAAGVLDQTCWLHVPKYEVQQAEFESDRAFVQQIEERVPGGTMIFQLPKVRFPECAPLHALQDYDLLRGYLHSRTLRWSYPSMAGRSADLWQRHVTAQPLDTMLEHLVLADFGGIYIDRAGYADRAAGLENDLVQRLGETPLVSPNGRQSFFSLAGHAAAVKRHLGTESWARRQDEILHPVLFALGRGFCGEEQAGTSTWQWCGAKGTLTLLNLSDRPRTVRLEMHFRTGHPEPAHLQLRGSLLHANLVINDQPQPFAATVTVPPGSHLVQLRCDARRLIAPTDARTLIFMTQNAVMRETGTELVVRP